MAKASGTACILHYDGVGVALSVVLFFMKVTVFTRLELIQSTLCKRKFLEQYALWPDENTVLPIVPVPRSACLLAVHTVTPNHSNQQTPRPKAKVISQTPSPVGRE